MLLILFPLFLMAEPDKVRLIISKHLYVKQALSRQLTSTALLNLGIISVKYHLVPVSQR